MKKNDFVQIKGMDLKELAGKDKDLKKEIADLTLDKNMKKLKDLKIIAKKKKDRAQVLTVIKQKELLKQLESIVGNSAKDQKNELRQAQQEQGKKVSKEEEISDKRKEKTSS
ncbi:MAG: hypothetical protein ACD_38C00010G0005 [uncultured bacterium]|nr:MAG: hypothetical protein ACD_38C00010G0005 [uncultured bacterium]KKR24270.1 MAG: 50S ribosomal protein L29 [Candidatus Daviesbacteria bacterium GW2011_GWB1_39_5]OGE20893.1 MAG: 50S ribosomal protein L29 [Candidatus Daviesbacteria bacterium RIFCSPHIGHO2_01_FULL_40_24]OGE28245.1 MAG: 50S ribosomal protein L29 [Candidatus Daviesbacteria bacterium RIFCSPHIGHO2_02_FULL_40_16]OGE41866.1 MAG: 50S ribosomal protein L29 [Candidatus Daviesbacteria bacterium RIFCSPLOWO2_01_FULL_39_23]OGE66664.1 MAG: 